MVPTGDAMQRTQALLDRLTTPGNRSPEDLFGGPRPDRQPDPFFGATIGDEGDDRSFFDRLGAAFTGAAGGPDLDRMPGINANAPGPTAANEDGPLRSLARDALESGSWSPAFGMLPGAVRALRGDSDAESQGGQMATRRASRDLVSAVVDAESGGDATAVSPKGAVGLMQLMPDSAMDPGFGVSNIFELADQAGRSYEGRTKTEARRLLRDPILNRAIGTQYLNAMIEEFDGDTVRALVAYNWGPANARRWDGNLASLPDETRRYVTRIMGSMEREPDLAAFG